MRLGLRKEKGDWYLYISEMTWEKWKEKIERGIFYPYTPLGKEMVKEAMERYEVCVLNKKGTYIPLPISHVKIVRLNPGIESFLKSWKKRKLMNNK